MREHRQLVDFLTQRPQQPMILATLVSTEGSTYRKAGARKIIALNGESSGSISGGCLEGEIVNRALAMSGARATEIFDARSEEDRLFGFGLGCQGCLTVEFQRMTWSDLRAQFAALKPEDQLWVKIVGLGQDVEPLHEIFSTLGWHHTYFSSQEDRVQHRRQQGWVAHHLKGEMDIDVEVPQRTAVLLMSHSYSTDLQVLARLATRPPAYTGILGPAVRREKMLEDLSRIYACEMKGRVYGPAGLAGFGRGPTAIALAVAAQLQQMFFGVNR